MSDPYQPPSSDIRRVPGPTLYSLQGVVIATVLGSLAAAVVIVYLNYRSLNHPALARKAAIGGTTLYLLLISIAALLPDSMLIGGVFIVVQTALAWLAARQLQGDAIAYHREQGGAMHSAFRAAGVGLATAVAVVFLFLFVGTLIALLTASPGKTG